MVQSDQVVSKKVGWSCWPLGVRDINWVTVLLGICMKDFLKWADLIIFEILSFSIVLQKFQCDS